MFARVEPEKGLPILLQGLQADDDPAVLAAVAEQAEMAFSEFAKLSLAFPPESDEALMVARVARYVHHPELQRLLPSLAVSGSPEVREAVATLWRHRPEAADFQAIDALTLDPVPSVRREAAAAAAAAERWDLLERMIEDPDPAVRREVALVLARTPSAGSRAQAALQRLTTDREMAVRAAAFAGRLLQGTPVPLPPGLDARAAADAVRAAGDLPALRDTARTAPSEERRLAAALALALLHDAVAREVARTDPVPAIRHRVSGALELSGPASDGLAQ
jgi:hypothetical protein